MKQLIIKVIFVFSFLLCSSTAAIADIWELAENATVNGYDWGGDFQQSGKLLKFNITYKINDSDEPLTGTMQVLLTSKVTAMVNLSFITDICPIVTKPYWIECTLSNNGTIFSMNCYRQGQYVQCHKYSERTFTQWDNHFISPVSIDKKGNITHYFPESEQESTKIKFFKIDNYELKLIEPAKEIQWSIYNYKKTTTFNIENDNDHCITETNNYVIIKDFTGTPTFED